MIDKISIIYGSQHTYERGSVWFINNFDFEGVKRFYIIEQPKM